MDIERTRYCSLLSLGVISWRNMPISFVHGLTTPYVCRYCVGTRRQALLNQTQIDQSLRLLETENVTNFEARMAAEVKLYWIIYEKCCTAQVDMVATKNALRAWQQEWAALFGREI